VHASGLRSFVFVFVRVFDCLKRINFPYS
jgi:tryptophan synthase beta chain